MKSLFEGELDFKTSKLYNKWANFFFIKLKEFGINYNISAKEHFVNQMIEYLNDIEDYIPSICLQYDFQDMINSREFEEWDSETQEYNRYFCIFAVAIREEIEANGKKLSMDAEMSIIECAESLGIDDSEFIEKVISYASSDVALE